MTHIHHSDNICMYVPVFVWIQFFFFKINDVAQEVITAILYLVIDECVNKEATNLYRN